MIKISQGVSNSSSLMGRAKYFAKDTAILLTDNIMCDPNDLDGIVQEFMNNYQNIDNDRGKNIAHSITLSLPVDGTISKDQQIEILKNLIDQDVKLNKVEDNLRFIAIHNDQAHTHAHILQSSSALFAKKRNTVIKKSVFNERRKQLEVYKNYTYPQLKQTYHYQQQKKLQKKITLAESRITHMRKTLSTKQQITNKIKTALSKSNKQEFYKYLKTNSLVVYKRGKNIGVRDLTGKGRNYRLNTLDTNLQDRYIAFEKKLNIKLQQEARVRTKQIEIDNKKRAEEKAKKIVQEKVKNQQIQQQKKGGRGRGL